MAAGPKAAPKSKPSPPAAEAKEEHATVPVRVSPTVHHFIITKANWGESIDRTLRRLLKIPENVKPGANGK